MLLIQNGRVMDPASGLDRVCDILMDGDRILKIGQGLSFADAKGAGTSGRTGGRSSAAGYGGDEEADSVLDATGLIVAPGLVDVHVHFRDPGFTAKEDISTGAAAAARGGFTSVVMMANTRPAVDTPETLDYMLKKGAQTPIHIYACANVTKDMAGKELADLETMAKAGAVGFTDDGMPLMDEALVRSAMEKAKALGKPMSFHEEDPGLIGGKANNGVNRGRASEHYGIDGSPREAEYTLIERDLKLAEETGVSIDIQHISTREGVELVRQARARGVDAHAEATPHHFTLTEEAAIRYGTLAKMNPPLRTEEDRAAIIAGIADGTIDMIATDHAPHTPAEKEQEITKAPSGIIGLETSLALGITELVEPGHLSMMQLLKPMTCGPASVYHLDAGYIKEGGPADLVLFDPSVRWILKEEDLSSKSRNTPFLGKELTGRVIVTVCKGQIAYWLDNMSWLF